jgi:hypothetical protein
MTESTASIAIEVGRTFFVVIGSAGFGYALAAYHRKHQRRGIMHDRGALARRFNTTPEDIIEIDELVRKADNERSRISNGSEVD